VELDAEAERILRVRAKAVLRKRMRALRGNLPAAAVAERSRRICDALLGMDEIGRASSVALFRAIAGRAEVDLSAVDEALQARGVRVAYPFLPPREEADPRRFPPLGLKFARWQELDERGWGFAEPPLAAEEARRVDVVVVPALCIDERGHRLGYGGGFYDRTLPLFPDAFPVGVAFHFQLVGEVPETEGDVPVRAIVTDERVLRVS